MSDIGPGETVQAVREAINGSLTVGALYVVEDVDEPGLYGCIVCGKAIAKIYITGKARKAWVGDLSPTNWGVGYCPCAFRKWPPPADEALLSEEAPSNDRVPA